LARKTDKKFNKIVLKRLFMARRFRPPVSLKQLTHEQKRPGNETKILVVVGTITDDERLQNIPKITVS
jgi:large subunit ribosomal protein L18e